jgi:A/G-specific adenine glycosylase
VGHISVLGEQSIEPWLRPAHLGPETPLRGQTAGRARAQGGCADRRATRYDGWVRRSSIRGSIKGEPAIEGAACAPGTRGSIKAESIQGDSAIRDALRDWHAAHGRTLRFRTTRDPWAVLVSEFMAQRTQVARVEPAWGSFLGEFPSPRALAAVSPASVLRAWAGLGYNRRALNLQCAAVAIVERHAGIVPSDVRSLMALPGVGPYTARAVAAIAFGAPVAALDTNIGRVVGRLCSGHGHRRDGGVPLPASELQAQADGLVDLADPRAWTHAMMDLGATVCLPAPRCGECPLAAWCRWDGRRAAPRPRAMGARPSVPFRATSRWLRGRIVARLRDAPAGAWVTLDAPMGEHGVSAVAAATEALEREGFLERGPDDAVRLPSGT